MDTDHKNFKGIRSKNENICADNKKADTSQPFIISLAGFKPNKSGLSASDTIASVRVKTLRVRIGT